MRSTENRTDETAREQEAVTPEEMVLSLRGTSRALQQFLTAQARGNGLGLTELATLIRTTDGDGVTPVEVGRALGLHRSSMTALSDRLERRRLIRRVPHPTDRRLLLLQATPKGRALLERALGSFLGQLVELGSALAPDTRTALTVFSEQTTTLLQQASTVGPRVKRAAASRRSA